MTAIRATLPHPITRSTTWLCACHSLTAAKCPDVEDEVCRRYLNGQSQALIAFAIDLSMNTVGRILHGRRSAPKKALPSPPPAPASRHLHVQSKLTANDVRLMCDLYRSGLNAAEVAAHFSTSDMTVLKWLRRFGERLRPAGWNHSKIRHVPPRLDVMPESDQAAVALMYEDGVPLAAIGEEFGVSRKTVARYLDRKGLR